MVTRGIAVHRVPWGNMYEFSLMVTLVAVTLYLILLVRQKVRYLGAFVMAPVVLYLGLAGTVLYAAPGPLVPALNSYWIKIHVVAAILATGSFLVSGVITVLYLFKERWERGLPPLRVSLRQRLRSPMHPTRVSLGPGTAAAVEMGAARGGLMRSLPAAESLDRLAYRIITFAFPVWTFAIIAGRDLGRAGVEPLLGLGPEGDLVVHHVARLRGVPARPGDRRLARRGGPRCCRSSRSGACWSTTTS